MTTCVACGRPLTAPASRNRGIGPVCDGRRAGDAPVPGRRRRRLPEDRHLTDFPPLTKLLEGQNR